MIVIGILILLIFVDGRRYIKERKLEDLVGTLFFIGALALFLWGVYF